MPDVVDASDLADVIDMVGDLRDASARVRVRFLPGGDAGIDCFLVVETQPQVLEGSRAALLPGRVAGSDELLEEVHVDDPAVLRQQPEHIVRDVAGVRGDRRGVRVRENHRRAADAQRIAHRVGTDVGEVDEHPEAIHLAHHRFAELRQAVVLGAVGRRVCPLHGVPMGKRHVARAQLVEDSQRGQRLLNHVAAFDADQRRDATGAVNALDIVGGEGQFQFGPAADHSERDVEPSHRLME